MMFETNPAYKVCTLTLQKKHTKHLPTSRRFDLRPTGPCFVFVYLLLIAMTSIFGLLDKRQRAEARRKKQTSGPGRFLLGGKIGAAPEGILPKRIQMKPTEQNRDHGSNRTHVLGISNLMQMYGHVEGFLLNSGVFGLAIYWPLIDCVDTPSRYL